MLLARVQDQRGRRRERRRDPDQRPDRDGDHDRRSIRIEPGASYEVVWPGALYAPTELPDECNAANCEFGTACAEPYQAPADTYTLSSIAHTQLGCESPPCACEPGEDWCIFETGAASDFQGEQLQAQVELSYPEGTEALIRFE